MYGVKKTFLSLALLVGALVYLASCAVPPPTEELTAAETAVQEAKDAGAAECAPEELAAAESALSKGKAWAGEFCSELEARRMLIDAKANAEGAKIRCAGGHVPVPGVELKDIFFDFDRHNIRPDAAAVLDENVDVLNNKAVNVIIEGYADIRGSSAYNLRLAQRRADAAKAYLISKGIDASRIQTTSGGETTQFAAGSTEDSYQLNRRAHFIPTHSPTSSLGARIIFVK